MPKKIRRQIRRATPEERHRHAAARREIVKEFPPVRGDQSGAPTSEIGSRIRTAGEAAGLTWYMVAKRRIPNSNTIRDIESGRDVKLSDLAAVADVLGLKLELSQRT